MFFQILGQHIVGDAGDGTFDFHIQQFGLVLRLELRVRDVDVDDSRQSFAEVVASRLDILKQIFLLAVIVQCASHRTAEARQMRAAVWIWNVIVGVTTDVFVVPIVVLKRQVDMRDVDLPIDHDDFRDQRVFGPIQPGDKFTQPTFVTEVFGLRGPFVCQPQPNTWIQEGQFLQSLLQSVKDKLRIREDFSIGLEGHPGAGFGRGSKPPQLTGDQPARELHLPHVAFATDFDFQPLAECVHSLDTDPVQPPGSLGIAPLSVELSTGVSTGEHDFQSGLISLVRHRTNRNPATFVEARHAAVQIDLDGNQFAIATECFVDAVVDNFIDQVVQTAWPGVTDVHRRARTNPVNVTECFDLVGTILRSRSGSRFGQGNNLHRSSEWLGQRQDLASPTFH